MDLRSRIAARREELVRTRRDLHRIPEVGFQKHETSRYVAERLEELGVRVRRGIAGTGVTGLLEGGASGPTLLLRSELDALPVTEATGLSFASRHEGTMHACGHDGHMAMALGAAAVLAEIRERIRGRVLFVFQPAEEGPGGAQPMIEAGILDDPPVDYAFGCHLWPDIPFGTVGVRTGPAMAAMDRFDLRIIGRGGHGAMPHRCIDALDVGAQVVGALQRIVSRQMSPLAPAVVTVGRFEAGTAFNIIAPEASLSGTTRTFDREIWHSWPDRIERIVAGVCRSMGAEYELEYRQGYPPLVNDASAADTVRSCAGAVVGPDSVVEPDPTMGGEDMAFFLEKARGCFYFVGVGKEGGAPIHSPSYDFDEAVLPIGVETHCRIALRLLGDPAVD